LKRFIPVNQPLLTKSDSYFVKKTIDAGWISSEGPNVKNFEKKFCSYIGHKYAVAVSSGSGALDIAVKTLNLKKTDEIIVPNFTIISNALSVIKLGIKIKFIDCDLYDWNMNISKIEKSITKNTKAIIATHIYNFPLRIDRLKKICKKKKIIIIEDAAEVLGQEIFKKKCGSFGDISTFSFYANKQITTGEGGMITTNNKNFYDKMSALRNLAFGKKNRFNHDDIGWNYRMTNIQATLGISQLSRIKNIVKIRHKVGKRYYQHLSKNKNIYMPEPKKIFSKNIYWVIGVLIINKNLNIDAEKVMKKLKNYGIGTRPFFWPMHKQKIFKNLNIYKSKKFPNSEYISRYGFYLPSSLSLKNHEIDFICSKVNNILS
jgi:perosamine synthetase|tara:strand:- start:107 stop:1228 length:1122 start_codon:yes stop_codon:yes gene_type:complete